MFATLGGLGLVVQLGVDEFEHFFEGVHASVRQDEVLHVQDDLLQRGVLSNQDVVVGQILQRPLLIEQLGERLALCGDVVEVLKVLVVPPVQDRLIPAVRPYADGRTFGIQVAL